MPQPGALELAPGDAVAAYRLEHAIDLALGLEPIPSRAFRGEASLLGEIVGGHRDHLVALLDADDHRGTILLGLGHRVRGSQDGDGTLRSRWIMPVRAEPPRRDG